MLMTESGTHGMVGSLAGLLSDEGLRRGLGARAAALAQGRYSAAVMGKSLAKLYSEIAA